MQRSRGGKDFHGLEVYWKAIDGIERVDRLAPSFTGTWRHLGWQLSRAASSIPLNLAEGCGRWRRDDKAQYFVIATGSAMECVAILDIADRLEIGPASLRQDLRALMNEVIPMLISLTRATRTRPPQ